MADPNKKRRYIVIKGNDLPPLTCAPDQVGDQIREFIGYGTEPMEPITLTETWLTDAQCEALGDWSP